MIMWHDCWKITTKPFSLHQNLNEINEVIQHTSKVVLDDMNNLLVEDFTRIEVEVALKQMAPLKGPGLDGMPLVFYQHYWPSIGGDIIDAVLSYLNSGKVLPSLNHTFFTLFPKVKNPKKVLDFRPIALCNILYKIISKVLTNRLKKVFHVIISESQSAFQSDKGVLYPLIFFFYVLMV